MVGSFLNAGGVLLGGLMGLLLGSHLSEELQDALMKVTGVSVIVLGLSGSLEQFIRQLKLKQVYQLLC